MDLLPEVFSELKEGRLPDPELLSLLATRLVGYGMTFAACFVKLPQVSAPSTAPKGSCCFQILKIWRQKSVKGLSVTSFELEVAICVIHALYCYLTGMPFSSYGESIAALVQNSILLALLYFHGSVSLLRQSLVWAALVGFASYSLSGKLSMDLVTQAFLVNQVIFVVGRSMQIFRTAAEGDASTLSVSSYGSVVLGKIIRIFTSLKEGATLPLMIANLLGFGMNTIAVLQILYYTQKTKREKKAN